MAIPNFYNVKRGMQRIMAATLLSSAAFNASAQSYDWVIPPATRIQFNGTSAGVPLSMTSIGCNGTATAQVISTAPGSNPFAFVPNCGTYNLSGTNVAAKGYRNVFPVTGLCKQFYSVEWALSHYPANSKLMLRKLNGSNPASLVQTDSVELFSEQSDDQSSHTVAVAPVRNDGSRMVYFYDAKNNALKAFSVSLNGTIGAVQHLRNISIGVSTFETYNQMEVSPSGRYLLFSDRNFAKVWCVDLFTTGYPVTELTANFPATTGRHIHGYEYVPMPGGDDRVYISWHGSGPTAGSVCYVKLSDLSYTNIFPTVGLPSTTSELSWGYTEIELGRDGQLYMATNPNTGLGDNTMTAGALYTLNITNSTLTPVKINGTTQVYINTYSNGGFGYKIQSQIDGETFKGYTLSPSYNLNGISQNNLPVIPDVILCDNAPMIINFDAGGYITTAGITLQKGTVSGNTFTAVGLPIATTGNPLGAPQTPGSVNVGSLFGLSSYTGGVRFTLTFNNGCTTSTITQTFNIRRAGLVADFKMQGPSSCTAQNRVVTASQLASSSPYTQPATAVFCKDGWLGALTAGIQQSTFTPSGDLTIQNYTLKVQQVDNTGNPVAGGMSFDSTQLTPFNNFNFNTLVPNGWFLANYNAIKNNTYFKVTLGVNTTPCGLIERYSYFRIIDGGFPGNYWNSGVTLLDPEMDAVQVFPNPAQDKINFTWSAGNNPESAAKLQISNTLGKSVLQQSFIQQNGKNEASLDISKLAPGIYYYQLEANGTIHKGKITVL
ncbi:T9SS type A sorting domain-containing protein [Edaphocola aurantiacus]|uniref:T9SS type A sorting domain-containing protein n=1 Tax=Edaphocola aurantiacus TaxID=2601682 RepID=UPI001C980C44|nr:T9SS type A sorting domain-containing protein [Edaphocola aurantiacus]